MASALGRKLELLAIAQTGVDARTGRTLLRIAQGYRIEIGDVRALLLALHHLQ
jgi:hypothetical protein